VKTLYSSPLLVYYKFEVRFFLCGGCQKQQKHPTEFWLSAAKFWLCPRQRSFRVSPFLPCHGKNLPILKCRSVYRKVTASGKEGGCELMNKSNKIHRIFKFFVFFQIIRKTRQNVIISYHNYTSKQENQPKDTTTHNLSTEQTPQTKNSISTTSHNPTPPTALINKYPQTYYNNNHTNNTK